MFIILILSLLPFSSTNAQYAVPPNMRDKLLKASTFAELAGSLNIVFFPNTSNARTPKLNKPIGVRLEEASFGGGSDRSRVMHAAAITSHHDEIQDQMEILKNIKQGSDTCKLQSVCLPVETSTTDPSIVIYPMCYEVMQCVGSCCNAGNNCHPHSTRSVHKTIVEMGYIGGGKFKLNRTYNITMEEHTSCSCYECPDHVPECPEGLAIGPSCNCECQNQAEKADCQGDRQWDEESCKCKCPVVVCPSDKELDERMCQCIKSEKATASVRMASSLATDIANLPKLTINHHHNHRSRHNKGLNP